MIRSYVGFRSFVTINGWPFVIEDSKITTGASSRWAIWRDDPFFEYDFRDIGTIWYGDGRLRSLIARGKWKC